MGVCVCVCECHVAWNLRLKDPALGQDRWDDGHKFWLIWNVGLWICRAAADEPSRDESGWPCQSKTNFRFQSRKRFHHCSLSIIICHNFVILEYFLFWLANVIKQVRPNCKTLSDVLQVPSDESMPLSLNFCAKITLLNGHWIFSGKVSWSE